MLLLDVAMSCNAPVHASTHMTLQNKSCLLKSRCLYSSLGVCILELFAAFEHEQSFKTLERAQEHIRLRRVLCVSINLEGILWERNTACWHCISFLLRSRTRTYIWLDRWLCFCSSPWSHSDSFLRPQMQMCWSKSSKSRTASHLETGIKRCSLMPPYLYTFVPADQRNPRVERLHIWTQVKDDQSFSHASFGTCEAKTILLRAILDYQTFILVLFWAWQNKVNNNFPTWNLSHLCF